jgi:hypothetical protein
MSLQDESQISVLTVTFTYANYNPSGGNESPLRLADTEANFNVQDDQAQTLVFSPEPSLTVDLPERNGGLEEDDAIIRLSSVSASVQPFLNMVSGRSHPPVTVEIVEYIISDQTAAGGLEPAEWAYLFCGKLLSVEVNTEGEEGQFKLTCLNPKQRTEKSLDSLALEKCRNDFASGKVCKFVLNNALETGLVTSASGNEMTITSLPSKPPGYWQDGYVEFGGHRIHIKYWRSGNDFIMTQAVPIYWEEGGSFSVTVAPGCNKSLANCQAFAQTANFRGIGAAIPEHHPLFEKPVTF